MELIKTLRTGIAAAALLGMSLAGFGAPQLGKDYTVINPAQGTESADKVEVLEVFSYACPHCNDLEPKINAWAKRLPKDVAYRRMPVVFRDSWAPLAKTYYSLEAMGLLERLHEKVFAAIHQDNVILTSQDVLFDWIEKQGVDRKKFIDTYNSFAVQAKVQRSIQLSRAYGITGVPSVIVNGKFLTAPSMTGSPDTLFPVIDDLIKMAKVPPSANN